MEPPVVGRVVWGIEFEGSGGAVRDVVMCETGRDMFPFGGALAALCSPATSS